MKNGSIRTGTFTAILAAVVCGAGVANAQPQHVPTFEDPEVFDVFVTYPYGIASADFLDADGNPGQDGFPEIAVAGAGWDLLACDGEILQPTLRVRHNTGSWDTDPANGFAWHWAAAIPGSFEAELAFADVTGINGPDLVLLAFLPGAPSGILWVYENLGNGQFNTEPNVWLVEDMTLRGLVTTDIDKDGDIDVIAASNDCNFTGEPRDAFVVFQNMTVETGTFDFVVHDPIILDIAGDVAPGDIALGDFFALTPGQSFSDLVTPNPLAGSVTMIKNLGNLQFEATTVDAPSECAPDWLFETITAAHFGADSHWDFAAVEPDNLFAATFLGNGAGGFQSFCDDAGLGYQLFTPSNDIKAYGIASGHLNGGNNLDLVVALDNSSPDAYAPWNGAVSILLGRPDGTFQTPSTDEAYIFSLGHQISGSSKIEIVDLNNDGFDDIIVTNFYSDNISVLINNMLVTTGP